MKSWKFATNSEQRLFEAIRILFSNHPELLGFLFQSELPLLRCLPEELVQQAQGLSSSKELLVRLALDLWCEQGDVFFWEMLDSIRSKSLGSLVRSLQYLRETPSLGAGTPQRQLKTESKARDQFPLGLIHGRSRT